MSGSRTATANRKQRRRASGRPFAVCHFCHQGIKKFSPRHPVKGAGKLVAWCHPGCGLRGSSNSDTAKRRRIFAVAGVEKGR